MAKLFVNLFFLQMKNYRFAKSIFEFERRHLCIPLQTFVKAFVLVFWNWSSDGVVGGSKELHVVQRLIDHVFFVNESNCEVVDPTNRHAYTAYYETLNVFVVKIIFVLLASDLRIDVITKVVFISLFDSEEVIVNFWRALLLPCALGDDVFIHCISLFFIHQSEIR